MFLCAVLYSLAGVLRNPVCVTSTHIFVARWSCATLFHPNSLRFLKMQGGFSISQLARICICWAEQSSFILVVIIHLVVVLTPGLLRAVYLRSLWGVFRSPTQMEGTCDAQWNSGQSRSKRRGLPARLTNVFSQLWELGGCRESVLRCSVAQRVVTS